MFDEKIISEEQYHEMSKHVIVIKNKSFFGKYFEKIIKGNDKDDYYVITKVL